MLQPRICLLGLLPFRPIIRIGCRPTPAECGLDRPAARARQIAGVRMTRLHGSAVLGSVRLSLERGDLEPGPVGAPRDINGLSLVVSSPRRFPWPAKMRGPARPQVPPRTTASASAGQTIGIADVAFRAGTAALTAAARMTSGLSRPRL